MIVEAAEPMVVRVVAGSVVDRYVLCAAPDRDAMVEAAAGEEWLSVQAQTFEAVAPLVRAAHFLARFAVCRLEAAGPSAEGRPPCFPDVELEVPAGYCFGYPFFRSFLFQFATIQFHKWCERLQQKEL